MGLQPGPDVDLARLLRDDHGWVTWVAAVAPVLRPDFQVVARALPGLETIYSGLDGMRAGWLDWYAPWATYRGEVEEAIDLGVRLLLLTRDYGCRPGSTHEVTLTSGNV